jgi:hypothetical protein
VRKSSLTKFNTLHTCCTVQLLYMEFIFDFVLGWNNGDYTPSGYLLSLLFQRLILFFLVYKFFFLVGFVNCNAHKFATNNNTLKLFHARCVKISNLCILETKTRRMHNLNYLSQHSNSKLLLNIYYSIRTRLCSCKQIYKTKLITILFCQTCENTKNIICNNVGTQFNGLPHKNIATCC